MQDFINYWTRDLSDGQYFFFGMLFMFALIFSVWALVDHVLKRRNKVTIYDWEREGDFWQL